MTPAETAIRATRFWVEDVVVGLNLCPFAHGPFKGDTISYRVSDARGVEAAYVDLLNALEAFIEAGAEMASTGFLIYSDGFTDFLEFNDFLDLADEVLREAGLEGVVQIASFHPDYRFAGEAAEDPAHFTNRSPYPMLHLIREAALAEALADYPDPEAIPRRNIALLRRLGREHMVERLRACRRGSAED